MTPSTRPARSVLLAALAAVALVTPPARAQMIPVHEYRTITAEAIFGEIRVEPDSCGPSAPGAPFECSLNPFAEYPPPNPPNPSGHSQAFAYQNSQFFPAAIAASGITSGDWSGDGTTSMYYQAQSIAQFTFRIESCIEYTFDATVDADATQPYNYVELVTHDPFVRHYRVEAGKHSFAGRLSPGEYTIDSISATVVPSDFGSAYSWFWLCAPCASPLIAQHPAGTALIPGGTTTLSVIPTTPTGTLTYQWRRDLVPLDNDAHIGGATTSTLTIFNSSAADTGAYDVVLTEGDIVEPSSLAHVTLGGVTGVEPRPAPVPGAFTLEAAAPNPSAATTSFRYTAEQPLQMSGAIYDAAGRVVRPLESRLLSGAGVLSWDGRTESGVPVSAGIYFLRVSVEGESHVRRLVRLP